MIFRIILFLVSIIMIIRTSGSIREKEGRYWETLLWLGLWAFLGVIALVPELTSVVAQFFGVGRGVDLALYLAMLLVFYLIFRMYIRFERMERNITKIVRSIALEEVERKDEQQIVKRESPQ